MQEEKRWKCGDVREDGMVFWAYQPRCRNGERWMTPEQFAVRREKNKTSVAAYYAANRAAIKARIAAYREANREAIKASKAAYYRANRDAAKARLAAYRKANREAINVRKTAYKTARYKRDPLYALRRRLSSRTRSAFAAIKSNKPAATESLLNCTWEYAKAHIEKQFTTGMGWHNRSEWHVDHTIPIASAYDAYTTALLCDIHNLRPMWGPENISKNDTWNPPEYCI